MSKPYEIVVGEPTLWLAPVGTPSPGLDVDQPMDPDRMENAGWELFVWEGVSAKAPNFPPQEDVE